MALDGADAWAVRVVGVVVGVVHCSVLLLASCQYAAVVILWS